MRAGPIHHLLLSALLLAAPMPALAAKQPAPPAAQARADDLAAQARQAMVATPEAAEQIALQGERVAGTIRDDRARTLSLAGFLWMRGEALVRQEKPDAARPLLVQALRMIEPIPEPIKLRGDILNSMGTLAMVQSRAAEALSDYQRAYKVFTQIGERRGEALALQNMAWLYYLANDGNRAERYYREAVDAYSGDPMLTLSLHNRRGNVLMTMSRFADARAEYERALKIAQALGKPQLQAPVIMNLTRAAINLKDYAAADRLLAQGFSLARGSDGEMLRRQLLATSAFLASERGDQERAARLIRECFRDIDLTKTSAEFRNAHLYAYQIFEAAGDWRAALQHLEALKRLSDESAKVATTTGAALMAARFDYANQELRIERLKREEEKRTADFQRTLFIGFGAATIVIIALLTFGLITIRRSRNQVRAANIVLNQTNVALEKALKAKTEFLATTSHEIRTPLNGILGMTQVMLADTRLAPELRDRVGIVHGAGVTMRALVDDILDVAKMETGNLTVEMVPMDLCASLQDVTRMWEEQARAKGLSFTLHLSHAPHWIVSDAGRLRQIVFNLLSNAIKFTAKGGITLRAMQTGEGERRRLQLIVTDTGIGIPADKREEIFESFKQVDATTTRRFGGTGLGLTICRNLAEALGGTIRVESTEGKGSSFVVDLPLVPAEAPAAEASPTGSGTLVVLDRNPIARSVLRTLLEPRVGVLQFLSAAEEVPEALAQPGVIRLAIDEATLKTGEGDPFECLAGIVSAAREVGVATAILWAKPDETTRAQLLATGVSHVIEKPVAGPALIEALVAEPKEKSREGGATPLVSHAA